jgi:NifU-like protein involved in Fe-S cluster formation
MLRGVGRTTRKQSHQIANPMGKFSDTLMDHFTSPRNNGPMESPDRIGQAGALGQGPFMVLYLRVAGGTISEAKFCTYGCGTTIAAGSILTELITGRSFAECQSLTAGDLIKALDGVPPDKLHSPALAIAALQDALKPAAPVLEQRE